MKNEIEIWNECFQKVGVQITEKNTDYTWERVDAEGDVADKGGLFKSELDARMDAARELSGMAMGSQNLSSEEWDALSVTAQTGMVTSMLSEQPAPRLG